MKSVTYPVLSVLVFTLMSHIYGLENQRRGAVGHCLSQAQEEVLPLPVHHILLPYGVQHSVRGLAHPAGSTQQSLPWLQQT